MLDALVKMSLLKVDKPEQCPAWTNFYSRLKVDGSSKGISKPYFDVKSTLIALYFLTSNKPQTKARYMSFLYYGYGTNNYNPKDDPVKGENNYKDK